MRNIVMFLAILVGAVLLSGPAHAQFFGKKDFIYEKGGNAIDGYDTVAYFNLDADDLDSDGLPNAEGVKGSADYSATYEGATWLFSSQENLDKFNADPAKYAPAYNGYCAYAAAKGSLAKTDPNAWRIIDGKLYLNFSSSVQRRWVKDIPGHITQANENWADLTTKLADPGA